MSYFGNASQGEKIFRGAYSYSRNTNIYSEETFEVVRDKKEMTFLFNSEMISRVSTGELLTINIQYTINKDYIPLKVDINRTLGSMNVRELYEFDQKKTRINYTFFKDGEEEVTIDFATTPKFFITTSATCSAMLYLRSKKFDATGKNYYTLYTSKNMWDYIGPPTVKNIVVQRISPTSENLKIDGNNLAAIQYKLQEQILDDVKDEKKEPIKKGPTPIKAPIEDLRIWTSQHMTIPYLIKAIDGTKVQVKFLNNLSKD